LLLLLLLLREEEEEEGRRMGSVEALLVGGCWERGKMEGGRKGGRTR